MLHFFHLVGIKSYCIGFIPYFMKGEWWGRFAKGNEHLSFMPWNSIKQKSVYHVKCKFIDCKQKSTWIHWFVIFASYFVLLSFYYYYSMRKAHLSSSWGSIYQKKAIHMPLYASKNREKSLKLSSYSLLFRELWHFFYLHFQLTEMWNKM